MIEIPFCVLIARWLEENNYDGLYNEVGECGCAGNELMPCGEVDNLTMCEAAMLQDGMFVPVEPVKEAM